MIEKKTDYVQVSSKLPADLHQKLKLHCIKQNISIQDYIAQLITADINNIDTKFETNGIHKRKYTTVYNDFLESELPCEEKILLIAIKRYMDQKTHKAFPSYSKLAAITGLSEEMIAKLLASLKQKGAIDIEKRTAQNGKPMSNMYTIHDTSTIWEYYAPKKH